MLRAQGIDFSVRHQVGYQPTAETLDFIVTKIASGKDLDCTSSYYSGLPRTYHDTLPDIAVVAVRGGYGYVRPTNQEPWRDQVRTMIQGVRDAGPDFFSFLWVDTEPRQGDPMTPTWGKEAGYYAEELEQRTGIFVLPYTNKATYRFLWQNKVHWMVKRPLAFAQYPFRVFNERILEARETGNGWLPDIPVYHEGGWLFWQCSADENGVVNWGRRFGVDSAAVDWDLFNGSAQDLAAWAKKEIKPVEVTKSADWQDGYNTCLNNIVDCVKSKIGG